MNRYFGKPTKIETLKFAPVEIDVEELFKLNWQHWQTGYELAKGGNKNSEMQIKDASYYIYSILGGIVFMRFNEDNQLIVKNHAEKQLDRWKSDIQKGNYYVSYLYWYNIIHDIPERPKYTDEKWNVVKSATVPKFTLDPERVYKTIDKDLETNSYKFTLEDIGKRFVEKALEALEKNDETIIKNFHNCFTSLLIKNYIIPYNIFDPKVRRGNLFNYSMRKTYNGDKPNSSIHFFVTEKIESDVKVKKEPEKKSVPTLIWLTGGRYSIWTIENIISDERSIIKDLVENPIAEIKNYME